LPIRRAFGRRGIIFQRRRIESCFQAEAIGTGGRAKSSHIEACDPVPVEARFL